MNSNPTAGEIAQRFDGVKNGQGWSIPCPSPTHRHKNPSRKNKNCSVRDGDNGRLLVKCFSQSCSEENILKGMGLSYENNSNTDNCIAVYSHPDGKMRRVYRTDIPEKRIWQTKGLPLKGCYLLLWGDDSPEKTIIIVEGEKAAKALQGHLKSKNAEHAGIPASYIGGVQNVHNTNYGICKGRKITVWPDNDNEGLKAGNTVAQKARNVGAKLIKIVDVGNLPKKGDAADIDDDLTIKLLMSAKEWESKEDPYTPRDPDTGEPKTDNRGGARDGSGRPKSDDPSYKTLSNRRAEQRTLLKNWLFDKGESNGTPLPKRFWMDDLVDADVERNLHYNIDKYCTDGKNVYIFYNATWIQLNARNEKSIRAVTQITLSSRSDAALDLGDNYCDHDDENDFEMSLIYAKELRGLTIRSRHCVEIMRTIAGSGNQDIKKIPKINFDQRNRHPLVPLSDGTTLDLTEFPPVFLDETQVPKEVYLLDHDWMIPPPDFSLLDSMEGCPMDNAIRNHYGEMLFTRIASYLLGTDKSIDCFTAASDSGKSTLSDLLMEALPGAVGMQGAKGVFHKDGQRFTPVATSLSTNLITIIDEVGHSTIKIGTSTINEWVQDTIDRERKGEQRGSVRRISSMLMVGHTYPHVNFSDQGIKTRFKWAYDGSKMSMMESRTRFELMDPKQIDYLRAWLFYKAAELWSIHGSTVGAKKELENDEDVKVAVGVMSESRQDPVSSILNEKFEEDPNGFVTSSDIEKSLEELEEDRPKGKALAAAITRTFHGSHVRSGRKSINGKQKYGWKGIKHRFPDRTYV